MIMDAPDRNRIKNIMKNIHTQIMELDSIGIKYKVRSEQNSFDEMKSQQLLYFSERVEALKITIVTVMKNVAHQLDINIKITEESIT